jgi:hypothetical protein
LETTASVSFNILRSTTPSVNLSNTFAIFILL